MIDSGSLDSQASTECKAASGVATLIETVTDRTTRVPLSGAMISVSWREGGEQQVRARTDSVGQAVICAPPERPVTIRISYFDFSASDQTSLTIARTTAHTSVIDVPGVFVRGSVLDQQTGMPLTNVRVRIANTSLATLTDAGGRFYFERIPLGDHTLHIEHISYATHQAPLIVREDDLNAQVRLAPAAIPLRPIVVTAFSRRLEHVGFYDRQKRGVGHFIGRKQIDAMNVQTASDLLRAVPGMRLTTQTPRQRNQPRNTTTGRGNCRFRFIVDGTRMLPDFEMDFVAPGAIEGVEVYNGMAEVPALFRTHASDGGGATCGVVAIWTRVGR